MKYKTFKSSLLELKSFYDSASQHDKALQKALGGDTQVHTEWWSEHLDNTIHSISMDFPEDTESTIEWLFWDVLCGGGGSFDFDGREYDATIKNVYLHIKGKLKPNRAKIIEVDISEKVYEACSTEELRRAFGIDR